MNGSCATAFSGQYQRHCRLDIDIQKIAPRYSQWLLSMAKSQCFAFTLSVCVAFGIYCCFSYLCHASCPTIDFPELHTVSHSTFCLVGRVYRLANGGIFSQSIGIHINRSATYNLSYGENSQYLRVPYQQTG
jgi:hypothetical protein